MRGNVMDLAVGVIIGGAFGKIVSSLVGDILMPFISVINGGVNFTGMKVKIGGSVTAPVYLTYGQFIQAAIDFLIIAAVVFVMVRMLNRLHKPIPVTTKHCQYCQMQVDIKANRCPHCTSQLTPS